MPDSRPRVLIVDDQPLDLNLLAKALDRDFTVQLATSGADALALASRQPYPDLILLDLIMPELDGYAVCAALKADPITADIPIVFITVRTDAESETRGLAAGGADFLHKPIHTEVVRARVHLQYELTQYRHRLEALVQARTHELALARDAAESANRAKSAFLHAVSHEMNTPLHQVTALAYLLQPLTPEGRAQHHLSNLSQAAKQLQGLLKSLLDFTQLEAGELRLAVQPFDPRVWLAEGVAAQTLAASAKGLSLRTLIDPRLPDRLIGDPGRLLQILDELLDNAIKFSEQGTIEVRLRAGERQGRQLSFQMEVADQGRGLEASQVDRLFLELAVGDDSTRRQQPGLGLGLALCHRLVRLMSGEIGLISAPGEGATVTCVIPLEIAPEAPERR